MTFLHQDSAVGVFAWVISSSGCRLELKVEKLVPPDRKSWYLRTFDSLVQGHT